MLPFWRNANRYRRFPKIRCIGKTGPGGSRTIRRNDFHGTELVQNYRRNINTHPDHFLKIRSSGVVAACEVRHNGKRVVSGCFRGRPNRDWIPDVTKIAINIIGSLERLESLTHPKVIILERYSV